MCRATLRFFQKREVGRLLSLLNLQIKNMGIVPLQRLADGCICGFRYLTSN